MSQSPSKFLPVISDAGPIIQLFSLNIWEEVLKKYDLIIADSVVKEAIFYEDKNGKQCPIDLSPWITKGAVKVVQVELSHIVAFSKRFDSTYTERFDKGELESLSYLVSTKDESLIVSGDGIVYQAMGRLNMGDRGISLEKMIKDIGLQKPLPRQYTEEFKKSSTDKGAKDFINSGKY